MLIVTAQLVTAYIIELFGIFGQEKVAFQWRKIVGLVLIIAGILTFKWKD
jgi:transporter family-2 protein